MKGLVGQGEREREHVERDTLNKLILSTLCKEEERIRCFCNTCQLFGRFIDIQLGL